MTTTFPKQRYFLAGMTLAGITLLSGCGLLVVGGTAATTAIVATDRRTTGEQVEDQAIELKSAAEMRRLFNDTARVNSTSYAGLLLLTGDVPSEQAKQQAGATAQGIEKVKRVVNELHVGPILALSARTSDTWLTSKVKTALINTKEVPSRTISITTERGVVYLLGKVTQQEGERAAIAASSVAGVNKVVKLFQFVSAESLVTDPVLTSPAPAASPTPSTTSGNDDVQAMPVQ